MERKAERLHYQDRWSVQKSVRPRSSLAGALAFCPPSADCIYEITHSYYVLYKSTDMGGTYTKHDKRVHKHTSAPKRKVIYINPSNVSSYHFLGSTGFSISMPVDKVFELNA